MIYFDGKALESVAPVMIEDIRVSPIAQTPVYRNRAISAGANYLRLKEGTRTIGVTFSILTEDPIERQRYIEAVTDWAIKDAPKAMQLPYHQNKLIDALCTTLPEPSTRQWWEARLNLIFTAFDPYFYDVAEKSAPCGSAFTVRGNAEPLMRIEVESKVTLPVIYNCGSDYMTFNGIPPGNTVIDLNAQTAKTDGRSIMDKLRLDSTFIKPKTGAMKINGEGTVYYRERW